MKYPWIDEYLMAKRGGYERLAAGLELDPVSYRRQNVCGSSFGSGKSAILYQS